MQHRAGDHPVVRAAGRQPLRAGARLPEAGDAADRDQRSGGVPSTQSGLDDPVDQHHLADRECEGAGEVEAARAPAATVTDRMPEGEGPMDAVVVANELVDNLPFDLFEYRDDRWWEILVDDGSEVARATDGERLSALVPVAPPDGGRARSSQRRRRDDR